MEQAAAQNWFAITALLIWPIVGLYLFSSQPLRNALLWTILGGFLLLPVGAGIKLAPGIPLLDKISVPALTALMGCLLFSSRSFRSIRRYSLVDALLFVFIVSPLVTSELNGDAVLSGPEVVMPGVGLYDGISAVISQVVFALPFILGRRFLREPLDTELTLKYLALAGAAYTLPMLFEIRMSPQLHRFFYGYYQFGFGTGMRDGGFKPAVFLDNGLVASFFLMTAMCASVALWRIRRRVSLLPAAWLPGYLGGVLLLCRSLGSLLYGLILAPAVHFAKPRTLIRLAGLFVVISVGYPLLRTANLVPTDSMVQVAQKISQDRADSLLFRFDHEKQDLDRALQRPYFGWGRFGRSRVYDEWGNDISVTDGRWIITLGQFGLVGFLAEFGLLAASVIAAASAARHARSSADAILLGTVALIIAINMIDLLPNASLSPWTWLLAGTLVGRKESFLMGALSSSRTSEAIALGKTQSIGPV
jgi:hypothetical protein